MKRELKPEEMESAVARLREVYRHAKPGLAYRNPFELLIATILSAQCTDERVNKVTGPLFAAHPTPGAMAAMEDGRLQAFIRSCGLYKTKAANIKKTCAILLERHGGKVPDTLSELVALPGVGRKTANVVMSHAFNVPALAVDTHVLRVSNRIGLARSKTPEDTERQLMDVFEEREWGAAHLWLIHHGRKVCKARNPACETCFLKDLCLFYANKVE